MKTIITKVENNRIVKFLPVEDEMADEKLESIIAEYPDAFLYNGAYIPDLYVVGQAVTLQLQQESSEEIIARLERTIDRYLDAQAQSFRYESIRTMVTYENDPNPKFNAEGVGAKAFRSAVYTLGVSLIDEVQSGLREVPTEAELLALIPKLEDFITY